MFGAATGAAVSVMLGTAVGAPIDTAPGAARFAACWSFLSTFPISFTQTDGQVAARVATGRRCGNSMTPTAKRTRSTARRLAVYHIGHQEQHTDQDQHDQERAHGKLDHCAVGSPFGSSK
jgi:hypothetical protein